jgi:hypothetical protein
MEKQRLSISCSAVTLDAFIACLCRGELGRLAAFACSVGGAAPTEQALQAAWEALYADYARRVGGGRAGYALALSRRAAFLAARLRCAALAAALPQADGAALLAGLGYRGGVAAIEAALKRDALALAELRVELRREADRAQQGDEKATEEGFTRWVVLVSRGMGYRIDKKKVTVEEFLAMSEAVEGEQKKKA